MPAVLVWVSFPEGNGKLLPGIVEGICALVILHGCRLSVPGWLAKKVCFFKWTMTLVAKLSLVATSSQWICSASKSRVAYKQNNVHLAASWPTALLRRRRTGRRTKHRARSELPQFASRNFRKPSRRRLPDHYQTSQVSPLRRPEPATAPSRGPEASPG